MNVIINQEKFANAVRIVERIVAKNISLPILNMVLIKTDRGHLKLATTNLELGIQASVSAKVDKEGAIAVPARVLSEFVNSINDEKITLTSEKNALVVSSESVKGTMLGMKPDEFPIIPTVKDGAALTLGAGALKDALAAVVDSASLLETRPELSGVHLQRIGRNLAFAATDSFRLAEKVISVGQALPQPVIIPRFTALEMVRLCSDESEDVTLSISDSQMMLKGGDFELVSRLVDGRYPDYRRVIPEKYASTLTVGTVDLERSVRTASIFSSSIADLKIVAEASIMRLIAKNSERGDSTSHVPIILKGEPFDVSMNYRYLLDGLKAVSAEKTQVLFSGPGSPIVLRPEGREDFTYVIMPLRTS